MEHILKLTVLGLALLACAPFAQARQTSAASPEAYVPGGRIPQLHGDIVIDGKLDDAAWQDALVQEIAYEFAPGDNIPAPVKTTVRLGYTADALYVAFHALDPDPSRILARLRDRDALFSDDWVGIFLDTFNDHRRGYELVVNPLGVQGDLIRDETNVDNQEDPSWDGLWQSAGRRTPDGYDVEVRIPFSTLRFPAGGVDQHWGISLIRNWPRDKRHQLTSHKVPRESNCFQCEWGQYQGLADARQGRNLEIMPTLTIGTLQTRAAAHAPWHSGKTQIEPGVDVSWAPSPAMTLNATVNPDFSQVETDQLQLGFNDSFALFYQEKRPFFLEGADYFGSQFNVLYTRQIANPDFGLRMTGRTDNTAYGAIAARDATTLLLVPGVQGSGFQRLEQKADVLVGRYRYDFNTHLSLGAIGTFRHGENYGNDVAGIDGRWQQGMHTVSTQFLHSQSHYPAGIVNAYASELGGDATPSGNAWRAAYAFSNRNWNANLLYVDISPGFRADLGFIGQVGYDKALLGLGHTWYRDGEALNRVNLYGEGYTTHRYDGQLLERKAGFTLSLQGPKQSQLNINPWKRTRYWNGALFREFNFHADGNFRPNGSWQLGSYLNIGQQLDLLASRTGRRVMLGVFGNHAIGLGGTVNADLSRQRLRRDGGVAFDGVLLNAGGSWQFDPRQRLRVTLQASKVDRDQALYAATVNRHARDWAAQLVYSYKVNPRTALYAGTSWGAFMDDENPQLFGNTRSVFVKLSYGWQP